MSEENLINIGALQGSVGKVLNSTQYCVAIIVGVLAFIASYAVLTHLTGIDPRAGGSITGILGGVLILVLWRSVRSDNRRARAFGDKTMVTTDTALDVLTTAIGFAGVLVIGIVIGAQPGVLLSAGVATIVAYWVTRRIWIGVMEERQA